MLPALLFTLASLAPSSPSRPEASPALAAPDTGRTVALAMRKPGRLPVGTRVRPVTLARFDLPDAPFTTYYAERDLVPSITHTAEGTVVRFSPKDGSGLSPDAVAEIVFKDGMASAEVLIAATFGPGGVAQEQGWQVSEAGVTPCLWADEGRLVQFDGARTGYVCIGSYAGRAFRLTVQSREAESDALGAHVDVLLRELRWRSNDVPLEN
ncbi:MAG TPA: hypothetical protein VD948_11560 [Rhodothermales bacterium]|nr:hypothetical protein [Rhodothermales bacterium]